MSFPDWRGKTPTTTTELFEFYHEYVKVLYAYVQTENALPQEMLFEINAAFDHLSRIWIYKEDQSAAVSKAYSHLKRSCLDVFKLRVKEARGQYVELLAIDTSGIDNGEFDKQLHELWADIKMKATRARREEGKPGDDALHAFDMWQDVMVLCLQMQTQFFGHSRLPWAKRNASRIIWRDRFTRWAESSALTLTIYWFVRPEQVTYNFVMMVVILWGLATVLRLCPWAASWISCVSPKRCRPL